MWTCTMSKIRLNIARYFKPDRVVGALREDKAHKLLTLHDPMYCASVPDCEILDQCRTGCSHALAASEETPVSSFRVNVSILITPGCESSLRERHACR
jgi:hypothetical protein